jgi:hypothetical protein
MIWLILTISVIPLAASLGYLERSDVLNLGCFKITPFIYRIWGSHSGGYEQQYLLGYNAVQSVENQPMFRRKIESWGYIILRHAD